MNRIFALGACIAGLAACSPEETPAEKLAGLCGELLAGDLDVTPQILQGGATIESFCSCYGDVAAANGEAVVTLHTDVLAAMTAVRASQGVGVEDAAEAIEDALETNASAYPFDERQLDGVGDYFQTVSESLNGGSCPA